MVTAELCQGNTAVTSTRDRLMRAMNDERGRAAADRLCAACVLLFDIEAAAMSLMYDGAANEKLGASGALAQTCDEAQFTMERVHAAMRWPTRPRC